MKPQRQQTRARIKHNALVIEAERKREESLWQYKVLKSRVVRHLARNRLFSVLSRPPHSADSFAEQLLQFFRFDMQPRYMPNEKAKLTEGIAGLPARIQNLADEIQHANSSALLNLGMYGSPDWRRLLEQLREYAEWLKRDINGKRALLDKYAEEWRLQADEYLCQLIDFVYQETGGRKFKQVAKLLTEVAYILEAKTDGKDKLFSDKEVTKRYWRHKRSPHRASR